MTTWNLRVLRDLDEDNDERFRFIECYYDDDQNLIAWSEAHMPTGESIHEFVGEVQRLYFIAVDAFSSMKAEKASAFYGMVLPAELPTDAEVDSSDESTAEWWSKMLDGEPTPIPVTTSSAVSDGGGES